MELELSQLKALEFYQCPGIVKVALLTRRFFRHEGFGVMYSRVCR